MSAADVATLERVIAELELEQLLDAADEMIEDAAARGDGEVLAAAADALERAAQERHADRDSLRVAAARARALQGSLPASAVAEPTGTPRSDERPFGSAPARVEPVADERPPRYAGFWRRFWAFLVDTVLLGLFFGAAASGMPFVLPWILWLAYFTLVEYGTGGRTAGKAALGVEVRSEDGSPAGFGQLLLRTVVLGALLITVVGVLVDAIVAGVDARKRSLHDRAAGTVVLRFR